MAQYSRVLICLVDAKGERIQAVASYCAPDVPDFNFQTDFVVPPRDKELTNEEVANLDIQPWVVYKRQLCTILDASSEEQRNPRTQAKQVAHMGMRAITVVPMIAKDEVFGTIHLERIDRAVPPEGERDLLSFVANQIALLFYQAQRLTLLNKSLCVLRDQIKVVHPSNRVLFLNEAAARAQQPQGSVGWQTSSGVRENVGRPDRPVHELRVEVDTRGASRAYHELTAPIDDFRAELSPPFTANGRIGYVRQIHDLSDLHSLHENVLRWLSAEGVRATARSIQETFKDRRYSWCRIYLLKRDRIDSFFLESLEEFGIKDTEKREDFLQGGTIYRRGAANPQPWHVIDIAREAAIYEENLTVPIHSVEEAPALDGFPHFFTGQVLDREALEKPDKRWIEAPLFVGTGAIGKISLSMPEDHLYPGRWELLKTSILGVAVALDHAFREESLHQQVKVHSALEDVMQHLVVGEQNQNDALKSIGEGIRAILGEAVTPTIHLYNEDAATFGECFACGPLAGELSAPPRAEGGVGRHVINTREPVYQDDVFDPDPGCPKIPEDSMQLGIRSFAAIPLKRQERILGVLFINSQEPIRFDDETQHTLSILASHAGVAIEIAELHETAFHASLIKAADLGYLASGISHEFLNSLQNIRILEGKLRRTAMDPESQRTLDSLLKEYDEAVRSIDTFKSFRDREILDDPVDLDALVSSVIALSERRAIDHRISLVYLPGNLPRVRVDTSLIRSIIVNLLHNAMDAVEGAPGERRVQLQIQRTDEQHFEIAVRDSGVGIAPDVKKKMFIPFFTTKKPKNMGVGLFWVQRIVQRLNGRLVVEPKNEMGGATFRVLLPLVT